MTAKVRGEAASGRDRRRSERKPHIIESWLSSPTSTRTSEKIEVTAVNLSKHGVAFQVGREIPPRSYHIIEIGHGAQQLLSEVRTVSCRKVSEGIYEVGAEFC